MVKHQKEKQYQSAREHRALSQIRHGRSEHGVAGTVRKLPFDCCALTLSPYANPACTSDGIIFDASAITPCVLKYKSDPVSGKPMTTRDIITLNMDKDKESGKWQCPVMNKPFSNHTKIVAIRQNKKNEANVYSFEAVEELNFKPRNYVDLISGEKFNKAKDVIWLNDPANEELNRKREETCLRTQQIKQRNLDNGNGDGTATSAGVSGSGENIRHSVTAQRIVEKLAKKQQQTETSGSKRPGEDTERSMVEQGKKLKLFHSENSAIGSKSSSGLYTGSLTSTVMSVSGATDARDKSEEELRQAQFDAMKRYKKKGYVHIHTNKGAFSIELHCDITPRTTSNFLGLAESGKYDGSIFHRSIRNFMIQCGKPANGKGEGKSYWGEPFADEFDNRLRHDKRGVVSMANSGPDTNGSQFFITFKSCGKYVRCACARVTEANSPKEHIFFCVILKDARRVPPSSFFSFLTAHLDRKHSVFGHVIRGMEVLKTLEDAPTDKNDQPKEELKIISIEILSNPIQEAVAAESSRIQQSIDERIRLQEARRASALGTDSQLTKATSSESQSDGAATTQPAANIVGKYLPKAVFQAFDDEDRAAKVRFSSNTKSGDDLDNVPVSRLPPPPKNTVFKDFGGW